MRLEGYCNCPTTAFQQVNTESVVQEESNQSSMIRMEPESVPSSKADYITRDKLDFIVLEFLFLDMELSKNSTGLYKKKVLELHHCIEIGVQQVQNSFEE